MRVERLAIVNCGVGRWKSRNRDIVDNCVAAMTDEGRRPERGGSLRRSHAQLTFVIHCFDANGICTPPRAVDATHLLGEIVACEAFARVRRYGRRS